jgi:hypothetical protein
MMLPQLFADGGIFDGALRGAIVGGIAGALVGLCLVVFRMFQKKPTDSEKKPPSDSPRKKRS